MQKRPMCGIAGLFMRNGVAAERSRLQGLADALIHRGPDSTDLWLDGPVGLLSDRLSIIDVEGGDQPLLRRPAGSTLVPTARSTTTPSCAPPWPARRFRTGSDCEPVLHLYAATASGFARACAACTPSPLHDPARERLVLARDPFGIKPLYYVEDAAGLAFASEPQALLAAGVARRRASTRRARDELLQLKYTPGRPTIFHGMQRLLPGETAGGRGRPHRRARAALDALPDAAAWPTAARTRSGPRRGAGGQRRARTCTPTCPTACSCPAASTARPLLAADARG